MGCSVSSPRPVPLNLSNEPVKSVSQDDINIVVRSSQNGGSPQEPVSVTAGDLENLERNLTPPPPEPVPEKEWTEAVEEFSLDEACLNRLAASTVEQDAQSLDARIVDKWAQKLHVVVVTYDAQLSGDFLPQFVFRLNAAELLHSVLGATDGTLLHFDRQRLSVQLLFASVSNAFRAALLIWHYYRDYNLTRLKSELVHVQAAVHSGPLLLSINPHAIDLFGDTAVTVDALCGFAGTEGVVVSNEAFQELDEAQQNSITFQKCSEVIEGALVEFKRVNSYKGVRVITPEKQLSARMAARFGITHGHRPSASDSTEALCLQTVMPGADFDTLESLITQRVEQDVPLIVCDLADAVSMRRRHGHIHMQACVFKLRQIVSAAALGNDGTIVNLNCGSIVIAFKNVRAAFMAAVQAREALTAYNAGVPDFKKLPARLVLGLGDIIESSNQGEKLFFGHNWWDTGKAPGLHGFSKVPVTDRVVFTPEYTTLCLEEERWSDNDPKLTTATFQSTEDFLTVGQYFRLNESFSSRKEKTVSPGRIRSRSR